MYLPTQSPEALAAAVASLPRDPETPVLLLIGEENAPDLDAFARALDEAGVVFLGGLFPGLLTEQGHQTSGVVAMPMTDGCRPQVVSGLDHDREIDVSGLDIVTGGTAFVLVDGLTTGVSGFLSALFHRAGTTISYLGAGAGSLTLEPCPCLISNEGVFQDAAIVVCTPHATTSGVRHGWERLAGPLVATETDRTRVNALNWEPAMEVYRRTVEPDAGREVDPDDFFSISKAYPFGISREGDEDIVRDPITADGDSLVCIGEVPPNSALYILKGEDDTLIEAARQAARDASRGGARGHALVIDCITRVLFLEDRFEEEWDAVCGAFADAGLDQPFGALTLGEIASDVRGFVQLYNKTCVAAVLGG